MIVHAYYPLDPRVQREANVLTAAGYDVDVICLRDRGEAPRVRYRGVEIHRLPVRIDKQGLVRQLFSYLRFLTLATVRVAMLHRRRAFSTVQVHNLPDFLVFSAILPKAKGVPVILDLHDLMPEFFAGRFGADGRGILARLVSWQERLSCRFADHVITVSEHWRQALISRGVPADRCSVVMNVADENIFTPRGESHGSSDRELRLIYHGTVTHRYGLDLVLRAIQRIRGDVPQVRLTIFGKGDGMGEVAELRARLGLEDIVELVEKAVPMAELPDIIARGDVGIVPYRNDLFTDSLLPTKLMEYAAMEMPCIASRTNAIEAYFSNTMVEFFEPGDIEDLADRIQKLAASPTRRAELAVRAQAFTAKYNLAQVGAEYLALVDRLSGRYQLIPR